MTLGPVAIYARFSSDKQSDTSIEDQVHRARQLAEREGAASIEVFADYAVSGSSMERPGVRGLEARIRRGGLGAVITESLDRVTRNAGDAHRFRELLLEHDVALLCLDGTRIDLLTYGMRAIIAEQYRADLAHKTLRGLEGKARNGFATGGAPYGYRHVTTPAGSAIEVHPDQAATIRWIFEQYAKGHSLAWIASDLNSRTVPTPRARSTRKGRGWMQSAVRAMLLNPKYAGRWSFGEREWRKVQGTNKRTPRARRTGALHTAERPELALVDVALWEAVQLRFTKRPAPQARRSHMLSGLVWCGLCGGRLHVTGPSDRPHFGCADAQKRGTCSNRRNVRAPLLQDAVLTKIRELLLEALPEVRELAELALHEAKAAMPDRELKLRTDHAALERKIENVVDALADTPVPSLRAKLRELEQHREEVARELRGMGVARPQLPTVEVLLERARGVTSLEKLPPEEARERLRALAPKGIQVTPRAVGEWSVTWSLNPGPMLATGECWEPVVAGAGFDRFPTLEAATRVTHPSRRVA